MLSSKWDLPQLLTNSLYLCRNLFTPLKIALFLVFSLLTILSLAQEIVPNITFEAYEKQNLGFDYVPDNDWKVKHPWIQKKNGEKTFVPVKLLAIGETDWIKVTCSDSAGVNWDLIDFYFGKQLILPKIISPFEALIRIDDPQTSFEIGAYFNDGPIAQIRTLICPELTRKIIIVPLLQTSFDKQKLRDQLNKIFQQANTRIVLEMKPVFSSKVFDSETVFGVPDRNIDRHTGQMRLLRDQYFKEHPIQDKNAYYLFLIPAFIDSSETGFMLPFKSIGFVPYQPNAKDLGTQIARTVVVGIGGLRPSWEDGPKMGQSWNLMDTLSGTKLRFFQIERLQDPKQYFSIRDAFEIVKTGNGTVAYYFWKENAKGEIVWNGNSPINAIKRPFKKNFLSYRFNLKSLLLRPLFRFGTYYISLLNFVFVGLSIFLLFLLRKIVKQYWIKRNWQNYQRILLFWFKVALTVWVIYLSFPLGNTLLDKYTLLYGDLPELNNQSYAETKQSILFNTDFRKQSAYSSRSETLIQTGTTWQFKSPKKVLYFDIKPNQKGEKILKYNTSSNELILKADSLVESVQNHYVVFSTYDKNDSLKKQDVFTYAGKKLENITKETNPAKRVLVFVNGYRPTSTGQTLKENFSGIQAKGFEYPSSTNHVYTFDRYEYWERWREINLQFQNKINPSATFYADGHFSVSTSNYGSLINFSRISQAYPERCENPKKHTCYTVKNDNFLRFLIPTSQTKKMIMLNANKTGFNYRMQKGRIAGLNLLQELNIHPNFSKNDTVYLVAHSMGYAYALGIVESLRGKIQFGGFYIIAPENAKSGAVNPKEWLEIWQYGSRFYLENSDAPCLQDGVAPQTPAKGLPYSKRIFIPKELYDRKGFFDSHFIGYYDWILSIPEGEKGFIMQR
jgi:hypothetical protein